MKTLSTIILLVALCGCQAEERQQDFRTACAEVTLKAYSQDIDNLGKAVLDVQGGTLVSGTLVARTPVLLPQTPQTTSPVGEQIGHTLETVGTAIQSSSPLIPSPIALSIGGILIFLGGLFKKKA